MKRKKNLGRDLHEQNKIYLGEISGQVWLYHICRDGEKKITRRSKRGNMNLLTQSVEGVT